MKAFVCAATIFLGLAQAADAGCFLFFCGRTHYAHHRVRHVHPKTVVVIKRVEVPVAPKQIPPVYPPEH